MTFDDIDSVTAGMNEGKIPQFDLSYSETVRARDRMRDYIERNPIFRQYQQHIDAPNKSINDQPWHALGERLYATYICLAASVDDRIKVEGLMSNQKRDSVMVGLAYMMAYTTPYLWSGDMEKLADAAPLPRHVVSHQVMPSPWMFWSRDSAYFHKDEQGNNAGENNWIALFYSQDYMMVVGDWINAEASEITIVTNKIYFGKTWPVDYNNDEQIGRLFKRCAFLSSPYVDTDKHRLAHHHRRQMERAGVPPAEREEPIHVVKLRRKATSPPQQDHPADPHAVEWKHQWWVQAHYRAQWYPSEESHKVIWIAPHLKGPAGLPVLEKVYAVVR